MINERFDEILVRLQLDKKNNFNNKFVLEFKVFDPGKVLYIYESPAGIGICVLRVIVSICVTLCYRLASKNQFLLLINI